MRPFRDALRADASPPPSKDRASCLPAGFPRRDGQVRIGRTGREGLPDTRMEWHTPFWSRRRHGSRSPQRGGRHRGEERDHAARPVVRSATMRRALDLAERVAAVDAPVLLTGESGSGKERVARHIHALSRRAAGPFVPVNCGAIPENLFESELFGHVRGAFTGADRDRQGLFEAAATGTLLLDEVGEIPVPVQVKLLRVLQDREVRPVGSPRSRKVDVRIVAATNRDLGEMVRAREFRKDLYYRLKVVSIEVPPLRERREDVLPLAHAFVRRNCSRYHCGPCSLSATALDRLLAYPWPGNVRELEHAMERAVVLAEGKPRIEEGDLPPEVLAGDEVPPADEGLLPLAEVERRHVLRVLAHHSGSRKHTAKTLGIGSNTLWRKLRAYGVIGDDERARPRPPGTPPGTLEPR
ncbi:MAG: sigma 54-interacting transcriptional regulator [Deltaproteobacteria bacterium]|nr:sigma 54-interacting transcriptional regulator [Deltaproteobacteria bacterium]